MITDEKIDAFFKGKPLKYKTNSGKIVIAKIKKDSLFDSIFYLTIRDEEGKKLSKYELRKNLVWNFANYIFENNFYVQ